MSEQQDKQRAIEALERAGFTPNGPFRWSRPNMAKQEWVSPDTASLLPYDDGQRHLATITLYANDEQVPAILNPMTADRVEEAVVKVRAAIDNRKNGWGKAGSGAGHQALNMLLRTLYVTPTDANPTGGNT